MVLVNADAHRRCWTAGCEMNGDLEVTLRGEDIELAVVCCGAEHWLPIRGKLINRGLRIDYGEGAAELIMAKLAPAAVPHRRADP
jgi:hypothetical protein